MMNKIINTIGGWYEGEYGANLIHLENVRDVEDLADSLFRKYGGDCIGVDMELGGEFEDGSDVEDQMEALLDELEFLFAHSFEGITAELDSPY